MQQHDLKTRAIVLKRTDYGEADRILQLLTPEGKRSVIARGVRKIKSKLAGGIELFSVSEVVIHEGKGELGILTSARLIEYFDALAKDLDLLEMAGEMMRQVNRKAEQVDSEEFFDILRQALRAMQKHAGEGGCWREVLKAWWSVNLARISGEEANLRFDTNGEKLRADGHYFWNEEHMAFTPNEKGRIDASHIKMLRLMHTNSIEMTLKVQNAADVMEEVGYVARCLNN